MPSRKVPKCALCRRDETQVEFLIHDVHEHAAHAGASFVCGECAGRIADALFVRECGSIADRDRAWGERLMQRAADQLEANRTPVELETQPNEHPRLFYWQRGNLA